MLRTRGGWKRFERRLVDASKAVGATLKRGTYHDEPGACRPRSEEGELSNFSGLYRVVR